ncbi:MAG TPA: aminoacetone oxidase family FAD-binding enzyme [Clostridiales bacterium]|nr:aminoacetone oxidase family FAD-binding enzyme [Clostridiales bacterium]
MHIAVIGGGAAGMAAAYAAASQGAEVVIFERNEKLGKKLFISGKGRCNLTNDSDIEQHMSNVVTNPRFLFSAYHALSPLDLMRLIEGQGVELKTERGGRVFPLSDKSSDIIRAWKELLDSVRVKVHLDECVLSIARKGDEFTVDTSVGKYFFDKVIVCTGGMTYQATGSTGDGYRFAAKLGHSVTQLYPALVGLRADIPGNLAGLSLKNVELSISARGKDLLREFGEMLFTHSGISGPIVLRASSRINKIDIRDVDITLDLKPALSTEVLDARLVRDFSENPNRSVRNVLPLLMPKSLIPLVLKQAELQGDTPCHSISKEQRKRLSAVVKAIRIEATGFEEMNGAIVTSGGINVSEVNAKDMQSKLVPGLYFAGEVLDVDALTGGYNLQIAFSTGYLAGTKAANG